MRKIQEIATTVTALATPGMKPKELIAAVRAEHPDAGKKEIVRAAFYAAIEQAETDPHADSMLHGIAMSERAGDEALESSSRSKRKPKK